MRNIVFFIFYQHILFRNHVKTLNNSLQSLFYNTDRLCFHWAISVLWIDFLINVQRDSEKVHNFWKNGDKKFWILKMMFFFQESQILGNIWGHSFIGSTHSVRALQFNGKVCTEVPEKKKNNFSYRWCSGKVLMVLLRKFV